MSDHGFSLHFFSGSCKIVFWIESISERREQMSNIRIMADSTCDLSPELLDAYGISILPLNIVMDDTCYLDGVETTPDEIYAWAEENKLKAHAWFFSTDLTFFVKGGRVSKTSGFVGGILNICPLLNMDREGKLIPRHKIRTKKKVIEAIVEQMEQYAQDGFDYNEKCYISHSACMEDAQAVAKQIESKFPKLNGKVEINDVGTTIGSHTGPGTVALFFWGEGRE